ncbi:hypothetical protein GD627_10705 [Arthrobacter yangruifuii]|uniref:Lipoprotein n=1 Tax=Arthrobacter yangruifuii TaxID=2606616 RepID=A0A5N6MHQ8_9MICC|nr:hypothetical protein [Arthrobacter yangruifuii]KAD3633279.1 hypothetical protein GD627_10705 [Arthrobacter yangruifuii]
MKKTLSMLSAAALLLAAAGCSNGSAESTATPSGTASAASSPAPGTSDSPSPSASPVALAADFPATLIPVMDGAEILASTVDRANGTLTAVLVQSTEAPAEGIFPFYDAKLTAQGFAAAQTAPGSPSSRDYVRTGPGDPETVNITVIAGKDGGPATVTVGATVLTEKTEQP